MIDEQNLSRLFNLLHDGAITSYQYADHVLILTVEIPLALQDLP